MRDAARDHRMYRVRRTGTTTLLPETAVYVGHGRYLCHSAQSPYWNQINGTGSDEVTNVILPWQSVSVGLRVL